MLVRTISRILFVLLLPLVPVQAREGAPSERVPLAIHHAELPAGATLAFSIANGGGRGGPGQPEACAMVEGTLRILGTFTRTSREPGEAKSLEVLHQRRFAFAAGEVLPVEFLQAASTTETVIVQALVSGGDARCLRAASAAVLDASGDLVSVVPPAQAGDFRHDYTFGFDIGGGGTCCACAPVCGCGICD